MMSAIKWINKYSREEGFVKSIKKTEGHFENTYDLSEARQYKSEKSAKKAIDMLNSIGEGENNEFVIVAV